MVGVALGLGVSVAEGSGVELGVELEVVVGLAVTVGVVVCRGSPNGAHPAQARAIKPAMARVRGRLAWATRGGIGSPEFYCSTAYREAERAGTLPTKLLSGAGR
jgi:hypothetical protein